MCFGVDYCIQRSGFADFLCIVEIVGRRIRIIYGCWLHCICGLSSVSRKVVRLESVMLTVSTREEVVKVT